MELWLCHAVEVRNLLGGGSKILKGDKNASLIDLTFAW